MGISEPMSEQDWRVSSAMNTLKEADRIQKDSKLMKKVGALASQEAASLQKLANKKGIKEKPVAKQTKKAPAPKVTPKNTKAAPKAPGKKGK
jgi:hypothetical protein